MGRYLGGESMSKQERMLSDFAKGRRDFILSGLRRFGEKSTNPFSGITYGEKLRAFNDYHPDFKIEEREWTRRNS